MMRDFSDTVIGFCGLMLAMVPQYLEVIDASVKIAAGLGGLALLYLSIEHKRLLIKKEKQTNKNDEKDN